MTVQDTLWTQGLKWSHYGVKMPCPYGHIRVKMPCPYGHIRVKMPCPYGHIRVKMPYPFEFLVVSIILVNQKKLKYFLPYSCKVYYLLISY